MSYDQRLCRTCLAPEGGGEHVPIFSEDEIARNIFLCSGVKIEENYTPALICSICLKDLSKAVHFRNSAIRAEKYFKRSEDSTEIEIAQHFEPEVHIKLEHEEDFSKIKSEPIDDANYEFIDTAQNPSSSFDVFASSSRRNFYDQETRTERRRKSKHSDRMALDDFGSSSSVVRCNLCYKSFTSVNSHQNHMKTVHQEMDESEMHKCRYCNRCFKLKIYLNRHVARIHGSNRKEVKGKGEMKRKSETIFNKEDVSLYCELCKQFFTTRGSLQKHVRVKHEFVDLKDRFVCDHCGSMFLIKYYLIRHIRVRHLKSYTEKKTPDQPTPCEVCGKILKNRGLLKPHMRSHVTMTADDYWYCDLCPRKFKTKGGCTWHIQQRHVLKATFPCKLCPGVVYKGKWELKCHIKSRHTNIRDFKCEICGKGFMDKQKLQIHTRIHTGERPHVCHICPQTFIHQTDLRRHIWGHTGERPYKCTHQNCGKGFMKRSELINHENRCHPMPLPVPQQMQLQQQYPHYAM